MELTDKRFWIFEALSLVCGELTFCLAAGIWFALAQVNWFSLWTIQLTFLLCWALGGFPFMAHISKYKVYCIQNIHMDQLRVPGFDNLQCQ